ncbi:MAG: M20 family metallopeptidase [Rikenellaceae bacterium]|nr:M20 family metallopeptidase [Rikenellaceae bacterium]MCL2692544.1 M20 family metallopeptidase [Rikenellaceae bacterium]
MESPITIIDEAQALYEMVVGFRRHLHRNPELSFHEYETARFIADVLRSEGVECRPVAGTGVLARIVGERGDPASAVVLRADMDALPVCEATGLPFASEREGVMHACGHDMHVAALMGAMILLNRQRAQIDGTVFGLFQPGEELSPGGATMVLAENPFEGYIVRAFFGQHVEPELPTGVLGIRAGEYMASTDELRFTVHGVGGHGAMRHNLRDSVEAAAALVLELLRVGNTSRTDGGPESVLSIGRVIADGATNIVPDNVFLEGTLRTFDERLRAEIKRRIAELCLSLSRDYGVEITPDIRDGFPSVVNSAVLAGAARRVFSDAFGPAAVVELGRRMTGEDFGYYTRRYPALFYRFGVSGFGASRAVGKLHSPIFNPDERSLVFAVAGLVMLTRT